MKILLNIALIISIIYTSCTKEVLPDKNAYRDPLIIGTWQPRDSLLEMTNGSVQKRFYVYTEAGYCGQVIGYKENLYNDLDFIWYVKEAGTNTNRTNNKIVKYSINNYRQHLWLDDYTHEGSVYYSFSDSDDTLFFHHDEGNIKDTLVRYKYQLIYDGPDFVGIDSTNNNN